MPDNKKTVTVPDYYDAALDTMLQDVMRFEAVAKSCSVNAARSHYRKCHRDYKVFGFLLQSLDTRNARLMNGPDLLRIEEENPADSLKPHGLQVIERCIYSGSGIDRTGLQQELAFMHHTLTIMRAAPDHEYQFTASNVLTALRTGVYGIISLDISGFDAPFSKAGIEGAIATLKGIKTVLMMCQGTAIDNTALKRQAMHWLDTSILSLSQTHSFNTLDRMALIKQLLNPLSTSLTRYAKASGLINKGERTALNMNAETLFAENIFNPLFFAPNDKYLPTPERIALGKALFFDKRLSGSNARSCGSCHLPEKAFTDGLPKPSRINGEGFLLRNTPTLINSSLQTKQFYDMRTDKLENQLSDVVHNTDEMGGSLASAALWMQHDPDYSTAFSIAYPQQNSKIDAYQIANAISSYVRSLTALHSAFDKYIRGTTKSYPQAAIRGFNLFMGKAACGTCHYAPLFNGLVPPLYGDSEAEVLAVPAEDKPHTPIDPDQGKARYTRIPLHRYAFKTPTVRNAALTAPYMHNGAFSTLRAVIQFYNDGGGWGRGIHLDNQTLPQQRLHLNKGEIKDIEVFIRTLSDTVVVH